MNVAGVDKLMAKIKKRMAALEKDAKVRVTVGYEAAYAIYVHENMEQKLKGQPRPSGLGVYWGPHGQPKFLEQPARELGKHLGGMVAHSMKHGAPLELGLKLAGLSLQKESQQLVPVEYGNLKASAFTRVEK